MRSPLGNPFLLLISCLLSAGVPAPALASYGLIEWSPKGDRALAYHDERLVELDRDGGTIVRSDSIPRPVAIAAKWEDGTVFVSMEGAPYRVDVYHPGGTLPAASLAWSERPGLRLAEWKDHLVLAGAGFLEVRAFPAGALEDSLHWRPAMAPVDLHCGEEVGAVLFRDRLLLLGSQKSFFSFEGKGEGVALLPGEERVEFLLREGRTLYLASPESDRLRICSLGPGEEVVGADYHPERKLLLLVLHVGEGGAPDSRSRVEVRNGVTGQRLRYFRSALVLRGKGETFELPAGAAISPGGGELLLVWPSSGAQMWDTGDWGLIADW